MPGGRTNKLYVNCKPYYIMYNIPDKSKCLQYLRYMLSITLLINMYGGLELPLTKPTNLSHPTYNTHCINQPITELHSIHTPVRRSFSKVKLFLCLVSQYFCIT